MSGSSNWYRRVESLYQRALDLPSDRRAQFLEQTCGDEPALRSEVEDLLNHYQVAQTGYLNRPAHDLASQINDTSPMPNRIGPYCIIRQIGQGGMGIVYEADQPEPKRRVALKVVRMDRSGDRMLRRFGHEIQALARLSHPGVAQIYEAGLGAVQYNGVAAFTAPYFAMELIEGEPLCVYAHRLGLSVRQRLQLFVRVCEAIQHAHQKGVIHRDLKPANILVQANGLPKVLDFGIARLMVNDTGSAVETHTGQVFGTLAYMSPEHLAGDLKALDTRSDVYSLGVILYELLSGKTPYDFASASIADAARVVSQSAPPLLGRQNPQLRGDLETIVAKALDTDPQRRYPSASELAAEINRHLNDEPIEARRHSRGYVLGRVIARHKVFATVACGALLVIVGSAVSLGLMYVSRSKAWNEAKLRQLELEEANAGETEARLIAEAVSLFQREMLAAADPGQMGKDVTVRQVLDAAAARLDEGSMADQPAVEAAVRGTLGKTYASLGMAQPAEKQFRSALEIRTKAFGETRPEVAASMNDLGELLYMTGQQPEAEQLMADALDLRRRLLPAHHPDVAESLNNLAFVLHRKLRFSEAELAYREALDIYVKAHGENHESVALCLDNLGGLYIDRRDPQTALPLIEQAYQIRKERFGRDDHPEVSKARNNLAVCLQAVGRVHDSLPLHEVNVEVNRRSLGPRHPDTIAAELNLARSFLGASDPVRAEQLLRHTLNSIESAPLDDFIQDDLVYEVLAKVLEALDRHDEAAEAFERGIREARARYGDIHATVATYHNEMAMFCVRQCQFDPALHHATQALDVAARLAGNHDSEKHALYLNNLGVVHFKRKEYADAVRYFADSLSRRQRLLGDDHPDTASTAESLEDARKALQTP